MKGRCGIRGIRTTWSARQWIGAAILSIVVAMCVLVPALSSTSPDALEALPFEHPSWAHPFGTDDVGRDVFIRTFAGGRLDLGIAFIVVVGAGLIGLLVGVISATTERVWIDRSIMRFVDAIIAFPFLILVLACIVLIGVDRSFWILPRGVPALLVSMIVVDWTIYARLSRASASTLRGRDFVVAARLLGYPRRRIIARHIAPGVVRSAGAYAVADVIIIVIVTASLSFLGAGVQPPTSEWGSIMYEGRSFLTTAWWITLAPGAMLVATGLALSLLAD